MERLQAALEKARAQRGTDSTAPTPARTATLPNASRATPQETPPPHTDNAWQALEEIQINRTQLQRNRVTTVDTGADSAPFDLLRTRMLQQAKQHGWKRIAIVSPHAGCGKSTTTINLALGLARQQSLRSIIFDLDLRRAGLSKIIGQRPAQSVADVLQGTVSFASQARRYGSNVAFALNNENKVNTPSEILQSPRTTQILDQITADYDPDIMLFDMPPLMASDDNFGFLQNVDAAMIMVAAEQTSMGQIDVAERQVAELTNVMGIVLNKCRYTSGAHGHEYDYY